jgi:hypothetical protein
MLGRVGSVVIVAVVLAACSSTGVGTPVPSAQSKAKAECQRSGGAWRDALNFCEYRQPG